MPGRIGFDIALGDVRSGSSRRRSGSFRILVMGDFGGRRSRGVESIAELGGRACPVLDVDNFDAVFGRISPGLLLGGHTAGVALQFESLDDLHPDRLYASLQPLRKLRESRARLLDPGTFDQEAASLMDNDTVPAGNAGPVTPTPQAEVGLLQRLIGAPAEHAASSRSSQTVVDNLVQRLVQPHIKPDSTASAAPYVAALDASLTELMRAVLHDPDFQSLEAAWRGVRRLVDTLDPGDELELHIVDVSKAELLADLVASRGNPLESAAHHMLARPRGADSSAWSLLVGNYSFGPDADDIALLTHLGVVASQAGAPFIGAAEPQLLGCQQLDERTEPRSWAIGDADIEKRWNALRRSPVARWLGLAMPRVLLRLPYGAKTEALDSFAFEEFTASTGHEAYLWGNPALACAEIVARAVAADGQDASLSGPQDIDDLPAHIRDRDGEKKLQACAEFLLPVHAGEEMQRRGMIPLVSYGNRSSVRIMGMQSIAEPSRSLAGFD